MKFTKLALIATLGFTSIMGMAQAQQIPQEKQKAIAEKISKVNPQVNILSISKTPWNNVYEVVMQGNEIIYTSENGDYVMATNGRDLMLLDIEARRDLTGERLDELNKIDYSKLDKKNSIQLQKGKLGEISVFADPNCIHCKRFEQSLAQTPDITVNLYLFPVLGPDSHTKSAQIWCSKDKAKVWKDWMIEGKEIPQVDSCDTSVIAKNLEVGKSLGINGTPTIVFSDGTRAAGAISPAALMKKINEISQSKK